MHREATWIHGGLAITNCQFTPASMELSGSSYDSGHAEEARMGREERLEGPKECPTEKKKKKKIDK